ncbi:MAG: competence protein [Bacteroidota bacterium]|nr:competence protein [Bacteroidota bacterium]
MVFGKLRESIDQLKYETKNLIDSNAAYYKLWVFKVITKTSSSLLKLLLIGIFLTMVFLFFSIAGALAVGYALDNMALGFLIVGGVYLIVSLCIYYTRHLIEKPVIKRLSEIFYNDED